MSKVISNTLVELASRRTAHSREFINPDGSLSLELSESPIHYKDQSGRWSEVINDLIEADTPGYTYTNKANSYQILYAENNQSGALVRFVVDNEHWIEISPTDKFQEKGIVNQNTIEYKDIRSGIDLKYRVLSDRVKEYLILNQYPENNIFSFTLVSKGIFYEKDSDGKIWFKNADTGEILFSFSQPFAEDSKGEIYNQLLVDLKEGTSSNEYSITVSDSWLKTAQYPVIIDPTIETSIQPSATASQDTYVSSTNPSTNYAALLYLHAGNHPTYGITRSFIKFRNLPSLRPSAKITEAYLGVYMYLAVGTDTTVINAHQITSNWQADTTTWNTQPTYRSTPESSITSNENKEWLFNITSLVRKWYSADQDLYGAAANYGILLKAADESTPRRSFLSGDNTNSQPRLIIRYEIDAIGNEDFWQYHDNVNVFNGNMVLNEVDVTLPGHGIPIQVTRTYNSRAYSPAAHPFGYGWTYNVAMHINYLDDGAITFTNANGNKYFFVKTSDGYYESPAGVSLTLTTESGIYVIIDAAGIKYYFNSSGKLYNMVDTYGNTTSISYHTDGTINRVTDPSGRYITFNYTSDKLTSITGAEIPTVEYSYDGTADLKKVVKKDALGNILEQTVYGHDTNNNITSITDGEGNVTTISYYAADRIYQITKQLTINGSVNNLVTTYNYQVNTNDVVTQITDPKGNITQYTCNKFGNVEQKIEDLGTGKLNLTTNYTWNDNMALLEIRRPKQVYDGQSGYKFTYTDISTPQNPYAKYDVSRTTQPDSTYASYKYFGADESNSSLYRSDVTQSIDPAGGTEKYTYNDERSISSIYNPFVYARALDYNGYGDIIKETKQLGVQENLLPNTSFERWTANIPTQWEKIGSGGTVSVETTYKVNGFRSVKLVSTGSTTTTTAQLRTVNFIRVEGNSKYNVSWYVKTQGVGTANGGATVNVYWYDGTQAPIGSALRVAAAIGTADWMRKGARINAPGGAQFAKVELVVNDTGTAWFDNIQMEAGSTINQYNFISNSSFEQDQDGLPGPDFWDMGTLQSGDGVVTGESHTGNKSLLVNGTASTNKNFSYDVFFSGKAGEPIYFSGWSKAQGVSATGGYYGLLLHIKYSDPLIPDTWFPAPFEKSTHGWQFVEQIYIPQADFAFFGVYGKLEDQTGKAWFDDITVRFAAAGNALISPYNILQNDSFENLNSTGDWPDYWPKFTDTAPGTYDVSWIESNQDVQAFREKKMIRISNVPGWAVVANAIFEPLQAGKTYTAYAAIKTENVTGNGAVVNIDILNASGVYLSQKSSRALTGTSYDWTVVSVSLSESEAKEINANAAQIRVSVGTQGATSGTMYFDMVRLIDERVETTYQYTGNYVTAITDAMGNKLNITRDNRGNFSIITNPKGESINLNYNSMDLLKVVENSVGLRTEHMYDKNSNVTQVTNKNKTTGVILNTTSTRYNELGLVKSITDPMGRTIAYEYDKNGNITKIDAPNGKNILFTSYDNVNRLKSISYVDDSTTWAFNYDLNGNKTSATKNGSSQTFYAYDNLDRITKVTFPANGSSTYNTEYTYNPIGQLLNIKHSSVSTSLPSIRYEYDRGNMNVNVYDPNNGTVAFMHDTEGRLKKSFMGSGSNYLNYKDYNSIGQLTQIYTENNVGTILVHITYEYDKNGNMTKETNQLDNSYTSYEYDNINQLTTEKYYNSVGMLIKQITYKYEVQYGGLLGNRTERTVTESGISTTTIYRYNAANELTSTSAGTYTFDANGNMTQGSRTYIYNAENQLIQIIDGSSTLSQYEYNDQGLRSKKVTGTLTEYYYYDTGHLSYITNASNNLKYFFTRDAHGNLLNMIDWTAVPHKTYWYVFDAHQSVLGLVDNSGQFVVNYKYDGFGEIVSSTGTITTGDGKLLRDANPFRYSSYQYDNESGFYYLKSRYYIPFMGRYLTKDKLPNNNYYVYCNNNPIVYIDPNGQFWNFVIGAFGGATINTGAQLITDAITGHWSSLGTYLGAAAGGAAAGIVVASGHPELAKLAEAIVNSIVANAVDGTFASEDVFIDAVVNYAGNIIGGGTSSLVGNKSASRQAVRQALRKAGLNASGLSLALRRSSIRETNAALKTIVDKLTGQVINALAAAF